MGELLWRGDKRYNDFSGYFREKFNGRVKDSIDLMPVLPANRDGSGEHERVLNIAIISSLCNLEKSVTVITVLE